MVKFAKNFRRKLMEKLLDVKEVSERLSIKQSTLRAWIFQRRLPVIKIGRLVRIKESALADWIRSAEGGANGGN
jgi:excisionase family DNA binding protein